MPRPGESRDPLFSTSTADRWVAAFAGTRIYSNRAADGAIAEEMVGEDAGHHGFAHRDGADADAGVVPAMRLDLDLVQFRVDRAHRLEDRAGRLDRETDD